ncbi:MAG: 4Fe-4S dicluster domain-containing protein, partial [Caldilineae bacterium]
MSVVDTFLNLAEHFGGETITLHAGRCLNARHRGVGCTLCADACPADEAITLSGGKPRLDNDACLHCGLCLHHCPTGAYARP